MNKRFLVTLLTLLVIIVAAVVAVFLAKGYTYLPQTGKLSGTGIISVTSIPDGASVFIDGHLTTATNATVSSLPPKTYELRVQKEGFIPWGKKVNVKEGLVSEVKITLFPAIPTIYPLTFNGVVSPTLSPDGQKLAFAVPVSSQSVKQKGGLWVWGFSSAPIAISRSAQPQQLVASSPGLDFTKAKIRWSPDSKQILATLQEGSLEGDTNARNYLLSTDSATTTSDLKDLTPVLAATLKFWDDDTKAKNHARILAIKSKEAEKIASSAAAIRWSPDETKFMYQIGQKVQAPNDGALQGEVLTKIYDLTDDKQYDLPEGVAYHWLPDSRHVILIREAKIAIAEFDGANVAEVYAGNFSNSHVFPWPDSSRLLIVSSLPTPTASQPNLYGVNLR